MNIGTMLTILTIFIWILMHLFGEITDIHDDDFE